MQQSSYIITRFAQPLKQFSFEGQQASYITARLGVL